MVPICSTWEQEVPFFRSKGTTGSVIISSGIKGPLWMGPIFLFSFLREKRAIVPNLTVHLTQ